MIRPFAPHPLQALRHYYEQDGRHRARWGLTGAEAILKLRAIRANGDWTTYWHYHLTQEP